LTKRGGRAAEYGPRAAGTGNEVLLRGRKRKPDAQGRRTNGKAVPEPARDIEEVLHPWRAGYERWLKEKVLHPELQEWLEIRALS
jgi:hypothetical protein